MIILQGNKLERSFSGDVLFQNISLQVDERDRIALVGPNGAGKSTLLKLLVGEETPTSGEVNTKKDLTLSYLAQNSRFESDKTIYEEMLKVFEALRQDEKRLRQMEMDMATVSGQDLTRLMMDYDLLAERFRQQGGFTYEAEIKAILNGFKFDESMWQMTIAELSGGQNTRLALAKMLLEKPELLVLDEPTNHLDIETIAWLENYLANYQGALIIVSHDRYFLDKVATVTLDLTPSGLDRYSGNYSRFMALKAEKLVAEEKQFDKQQKEIAKLEDFVQKNIVRASTTKRAQARRKQLEKIERLDKPTSGRKSAHMTFHAEKPSGNVVLRVEEAAIGYGDQALSEPINVDINKLDAIAVVGPNGIGKSTLIKSIIGQLPLLKGQLKYGANVETGYYDQTQSHLTPSNTVLEELWQDFSTTSEVDIRNRLGAFLFSGDDVKKSVSMLSGGEKARLLLAKLSMENNNFLVLDEPTNHLDIDSKEVLENALIDFDGTLLFVSHDRYFINRLATKVLEITEKGSTLYLGDYDYYLEKKAELEELARLAAGEDVEETVEASATDYQLQKANQKERRRLARRYEEIEARLETIEERIGAIQEDMHACNDTIQLMTWQEEWDQLDQEQQLLMEEWESIAEQIES
ncbi:ABC-F family ATP-binding cassette domain-containing protein [Streptococcus dysgalactiae]|uniref:ABC-F family ATP-binding cassette domain-containing protein n=1 Tax=Streptococcus dysgalactiae subsp. equisimilis TaxID=119602 RepID=A0AB38XYJ5_STREQ|nr:ABC-F family ATP-binding cassette domain-containing protein [Streptococcus dysgalactiae]KKC21419.1 multidrug ABC transporter ATP-binding protein [Streptococcus dysgalactiae subsp. equisimilis]KKC22385.1 multidrug ABC transporter ATP-binding protein [Streptococcus dysgalactiae subsp. equisimilis]MBM6513654.1 ABC-F family ATP-binding cassette domain-containing protein [Streptococcus dysgalactiae subsp. equisimilis]MBM6533128.1 ABC-F family ATP-binding cassette domain-containing protein [Strept